MTDDFERAIAERQIAGNPYDRPETAGNRPRRPRKPAVEVLGLKLERDYQRAVTDFADMCGWEWYHPYNPHMDKPGYPDLTMWHPRHGVIFRELKRDGEYPTPEQVDTIRSLQAAGADAKVWWLPSQWDTVEKELNP